MKFDLKDYIQRKGNPKSLHLIFMDLFPTVNLRDIITQKKKNKFFFFRISFPF